MKEQQEAGIPFDCSGSLHDQKEISMGKIRDNSFVECLSHSFFHLQDIHDNFIQVTDYDKRICIKDTKDYKPMVGDIVRITKGHSAWNGGQMDKYIGLLLKISEVINFTVLPSESDLKVKFYTESLSSQHLDINKWTWRYSCGHFEPVSKLSGVD